MLKLAHIINPVTKDASSDLFVAQPITFETMKKARYFSIDKVDVELFTTQFAEDRPLLPEGFIATDDLTRSILDFTNFTEKRKLPLIKDILDRLHEFSRNADYLIYTNVDIALMPYFYVTVGSIIEDGYDAFTINRRTISEKYKNVDQICLMYSQIGEKHPGYDCFVFKRSLYPNFRLGKACIGANWIGRLLITNLICNANRFHEFENLHMTFHIGDRREWKTPEHYDYDSHNNEELSNILEHYKDLKKNQGYKRILQFIIDVENNQKIYENEKRISRISNQPRKKSFLKRLARKFSW